MSYGFTVEYYPPNPPRIIEDGERKSHPPVASDKVEVDDAGKEEIDMSGSSKAQLVARVEKLKRELEAQKKETEKHTSNAATLWTLLKGTDYELDVAISSLRQQLTSPEGVAIRLEAQSAYLNATMKTLPV